MNKIANLILKCEREKQLSLSVCCELLQELEFQALDDYLENVFDAPKYSEALHFILFFLLK